METESDQSTFRTPFSEAPVFENQGQRLAQARRDKAAQGGDYVEAPNKQAWEQVLEQSTADPALDLHNAASPNLVVLHERPEHRAIIILKAQLLSNKEIAEHTGYTQSWISQLTRQPWFRQRLLQIMHDAGADPIKSILQGAATDSIFNIIDLSNSAESETVRLGANREILDRYLGKAVTKVETYDGGKVPTTEKMEALDAEIQKTAEAIKIAESKK